jgi:hypothetical protein
MNASRSLLARIFVLGSSVSEKGGNLHPASFARWVGLGF